MLKSSRHPMRRPSVLPPSSCSRPKGISFLANIHPIYIKASYDFVCPEQHITGPVVAPPGPLVGSTFLISSNFFCRRDGMQHYRSEPRNMSSFLNGTGMFHQNGAGASRRAK